MLTEQQLEKLLETLNDLTKELKKTDEIASHFRFNWRLADELSWNAKSGHQEVPEQVQQFLGKEQQEYLRYLFSHLNHLANTISYLQSFIDVEGNFIISPSDEDEDEDWQGTSNAGMRLANELHRLDVPPEKTVNVIKAVLLGEMHHAQNYVKRVYAGATL